MLPYVTALGSLKLTHLQAQSHPLSISRLLRPLAVTSLSLPSVRTLTERLSQLEFKHTHTHTQLNLISSLSLYHRGLTGYNNIFFKKNTHTTEKIFLDIRTLTYTFNI